MVFVLGGNLPEEGNSISKCSDLLIFGYVRITILQTKNGLKSDLTKKVCKRSQKRVVDVY